MTEVMARVEGLGVRRDDFEVRDVSFELRRGEVIGLVGLNGAGKTTIIRSLLGLEAPDSGRAEMFGRPSGSPDALARVGVVLDRPTAMPEWKVDTLGRRFAPFYPRWDERRFVNLCDELGVPAARRVGDLSRGQGVKLALAVALAQTLELLILDEPSSGLDPASRRQMTALVRDFVSDPSHGALFSTHITTDLDDLAHTLVVVAGGRIAGRGPLDEMKRSFSLASGHGTPPATGLLGVQRSGDEWSALTRAADSAGLGPEVALTPASIDDIIIHLAHDEKESAA